MMTTKPAGRRSTLRQKGWSPTSAFQSAYSKTTRSPVNLQKPLPPRPASFSSSVYSDGASSFDSAEDYQVDMTSRQNPNRYGMDVSKILPTAHPDCGCGIDEEDSGESSSPVTPVGSADCDPGLRLPIYSTYSSSGSFAYNSTPKSYRKSNDFRRSVADPPVERIRKPVERIKASGKTFTLMDQGAGRRSGTKKAMSPVERATEGLGIKDVPVAQPTITFAAAAAPSNAYSERAVARRAAAAPPPLKLYERALADSYVKTPYPRTTRHMSVMTQKSVFEDGDDDDGEDDDYRRFGGRRRKDSLYAKRFSGLGDLTQTLRRSSMRLSMSHDVQEIIPSIAVQAKHRTPRMPPMGVQREAAPVTPTSVGRATAVHEPASPGVQPRRTTSAPAPSPGPGRVKTMLMKAKRSLSMGFAAEESKKEKKEKRDRETLRKMVKSGTADARLGQNFV
ncbi:uncharacterized protein B0I36DRAFT_89420 [Microdochium trichocladiopsis]|uniref:Uncharacterized protein n=1 Tax=Microdochium trichocladiopsis TaxID=1682393 RepID=A0A9P8YBV9_9PEZI|nr:uncharacterized protein B0I36DRAFT_89420 [Microdochium trichocladiopsis]KAH7035199.1 hypothetical protein B0I36DRAFT_89420 [Microdochium trichocladiopsis]